MNPNKINLCGLVTRVSTDIQALRKEGSLENQISMLRGHIELKNKFPGEEWIEVDKFELRGISGKDSIESREIQRLRNDIREGKINTILCTQYDRLSRSSRDFINFIYDINKLGANLVSLKEGFDTTTPHGKLSMTFIIALAEFERENIAGRFKQATLSRAKRGLWSGGPPIGYDCDPSNDKKGHLIVNDEEKAMVNFAFDTFLECGSIKETCSALNNYGFRKKGYHSRRDIYHPPRKFSWFGIEYLLKNLVYVGIREINKKKRHIDQNTLPDEDRYYQITDVRWKPIVDKDKFDKVQALLKMNYQTKHNVTKEIKHNYLLNGGLLWCGKCGSVMQGGSGTAKNKRRYYYYYCKDCSFRVSSPEVEGIVIKRLEQLSKRSDIINEIIQIANSKHDIELPFLQQQKKLKLKELEHANDTVSVLMKDYASVSQDVKGIFTQQLEKLGKTIGEIKTFINSLDLKVGGIKDGMVTQEVVMHALGKFSEVISKIPPYEQKELIQLILQKAILKTDKMEIALFGNSDPRQFPPRDVESRSQISTWYAREGSNLQPTAPEAVALSS